MFIKFDEFKEFLALIETEEDKENTPVFIEKNIEMTETGMQTGHILIQYQYDTEMLVVFKTSEGIDPVILQSTGFLQTLEYFTDKETVEKAQKNYLTMLQKFNDSLDTEYEKAIQVLKSRGFETIIPYAWSV